MIDISSCTEGHLLLVISDIVYIASNKQLIKANRKISFDPLNCLVKLHDDYHLSAIKSDHDRISQEE